MKKGASKRMRLIITEMGEFRNVSMWNVCVSNLGGKGTPLGGESRRFTSVKRFVKRHLLEEV